MRSDNIEIRDRENIRTLYVNGDAQSAIDMSNPDNYVFEYMKYFSFPFLLTDVQRALFIGGGGFTGPRIYSSLGVSVDAVEIDHKIVEVACEKFGIDSSQFKIIVGEGFEFLAKSRDVYDVIVLDAFIGNKTPLQLSSTDFYMLVLSHLSSRGLFIANHITAPGASLYESIYSKISRAFRTVYVFDNEPLSVQSRNMIFIACNAKRLSMDELLAINKNSKLDFAIEIMEKMI